MTLVDKPIVAISRVAFKRSRDRAKATRTCEILRRRRDENGAGVEMQQPNDWRSIRSQIRIDRETGVPTAGSPVREIQLGQHGRRQLPDSRAGSQDCVAGTPKPARQD